MRARPWRRALSIALIAVLGSVASASGEPHGSHEEHWEVAILPSGGEACLGEARDFRFIVTSYTWDNDFAPGTQMRRGGLAMANLAVTVDGHPAFSGQVSEATVHVRFDHRGDVVIGANVSPPPFAGGEDLFPGSDGITVRVKDCSYEVWTGSLWHLHDGGFEPVAGATIDPVVLRPDGDGAFAADTTMTTEAVAFPVGGCRPSFSVSDVKAHIRGSLSADGSRFNIIVTYEDGSTSMAGTGVRCGVSGGRTDSFSLGPIGINLPVPVTSGVPVTGPPIAHRLTTGRKVYAGTTWVTLRRTVQ